MVKAGFTEEVGLDLPGYVNRVCVDMAEGCARRGKSRGGRETCMGSTLGPIRERARLRTGGGFLKVTGLLNIFEHREESA